MVNFDETEKLLTRNRIFVDRTKDVGVLPKDVAIDYGVTGGPETYVIDRKGVIRYTHIGPLTPEVAQKKLAPLVKELRGG